MQRKGTKRPYTTVYLDELKATASPASLGHSASEKGAIRAAVVRIFMDEHKMALIHYDGSLIYTVKPGPKGMQIHYGRAL